MKNKITKIEIESCKTQEKEKKKTIRQFEQNDFSYKKAMLPPDKSHNVNNGFKERIKSALPALWGIGKDWRSAPQNEGFFFFFKIFIIY